MELTIFEHHGLLYADSREVAEMVGKRHDNLLRDIGRYTKVLSGGNTLRKTAALKSEVSELDAKDFFVPVTYADSTGRELPRYLITRKGCDMIAHKLTGDKGILFTATYINRFYAMERALLERQSPQWQTARLEGKKARRMETDAIKAFVQYAAAQGSRSADKYYIHFSNMADKAAGITDRDTASTEQLLNLRMIEKIIERAVLSEISAGTEYHQAYQNVNGKVQQFAVLAFAPVLALAS